MKEDDKNSLLHGNEDCTLKRDGRVGEVKNVVDEQTPPPQSRILRYIFQSFFASTTKFFLQTIPLTFERGSRSDARDDIKNDLCIMETNEHTHPTASHSTKDVFPRERSGEVRTKTFNRFVVIDSAHLFGYKCRQIICTNALSASDCLHMIMNEKTNVTTFLTETADLKQCHTNPVRMAL